MKTPLTVLVTCLLITVALSPGVSAQTTQTIRVEALIDGRSQLLLSAGTAQWFHLDFAAPGRHNFQNVPTTINGIQWFPVWPDVPNAENRFCSCFSDIFSGVNPPLLQLEMSISLSVIQGRSGVSIIQLPAAHNNFTLVIEFDDNAPAGSEVYIVDIDFAPRVLAIEIDVKPGSFPNSLNPRSRGKTPVAILTTNTFDATTVDPSTVLFGASGTEAAPVHSALEDVDGDGDVDMILHFNTQDTGVVCGATSASLTGETVSGQPIEGSDSVRTVGCK